MTSGPRIAVLGTFDVDNYGDHLFPRVAAHELERRLPGVVVTPYSPYGRAHPTSLDDGRAAEPLGPWTPERARELAGAHDLVVVGGGELIHLNDPLLAPVYGRSAGELAALAPSRFFVEGLGPELERRCPVVWHGLGVPWGPSDPTDPTGSAEAQRLRAALTGRRYVTVRDRFSAERLAAAGVDGPVEVVPDSALLLPRLLPPERLAARAPVAGRPPLVVQGCDLMVPHLDEVAAAVQSWRAAGPDPVDVLAIETGRCRGDALFADGVARRLDSVRRLPSGALVEDIAAALATGAAFVGSSLHGAITALAYGRPFVLLNLHGEAKLDGFGDLTGLGWRVVRSAAEIPAVLDKAMAEPVPAGLLSSLSEQLDRHFDRIAGLASHPRTRLSPRPGLGDRLRRRLSGR